MLLIQDEQKSKHLKIFIEYILTCLML